MPSSQTIEEEFFELRDEIARESRMEFLKKERG